MNRHALDKIYIRELRGRCILGVYQEEREKEQEVEINLTMYADLSKPCVSDQITDTIDYKGVKQDILALVQSSQFFLVERLAGSIAELVLRHPRVMAVDVTVDKPGALRFARSVAVQIHRRQD
jgi:FolB domain-containing protein